MDKGYQYRDFFLTHPLSSTHKCDLCGNLLEHHVHIFVGQVMPRQVRCPWTKEEDSIISELVIIHTKQWSKIANDLEKQSTNTLRIRTGKQCRERWHNHLNPDVNKAAWTPEEDAILEEAHQRLG